MSPIPRHPRLLKAFGNGTNGVSILNGAEGLAIKDNTLYVLGSQSSALNIFDLRSQLGLEVDAFVGIGTATPRSALDVAGAINAQGDVVAGGTIFGNGSGLTSLKAENLTGTVPDAALSANVALRQGGNNFAGLQTVTGNQTIFGRLGVGTANPATTLHIRQATDNGGFDTDNDGIRLEAASGEYWGIQTQAGGDLVFNNGTDLAYVYISRNSGLIHITSDARFKKNVHSLDRTLERVQQLRPVTFQYRQAPDDSPPIVGFIAQEVQPLFPEVVDVKEGRMAIAYESFGPIAIRAIQELNQKLEERCKKAEAENAALKERLERLEKLVEAMSAQNR